MGRKTEPGISYYPMKANHLTNDKLRLLYNEFRADGYWIWSCLVARIYEDRGYYMDVEDEDKLELFATDVCKMQVSLVKEVINGCVRRGLFDKSVFDAFKILTSDRIQLNYIEATSERRRKGTEITIIDEIMLVEMDEAWKNLIVTGINDILPWKKEIIPRKNPQSKKKVKEKKSKEEDGACAPKSFKDFTEKDFIEEIGKHKDDFPYEMRNNFFKYWKEKNPGGKMRFQLEKTWETALRLEKWKSNQGKFSNNENNRANVAGSTHGASNGKPGTSHARTEAIKNF
jgi:hypothetical protein